MRAMAVLAVAALLAGCGGRGDLPPDASGEQVYTAICAVCHGAGLEGGIGPALDPGSEAAALSDEFYRVTITQGLGRMPSYGGTLSPEQVERVIGYVRRRQQEG